MRILRRLLLLSGYCNTAIPTENFFACRERASGRGEAGFYASLKAV